MHNLGKFWGKTGFSAEGKPIAKPVLHHLLDVAAVAWVLIEDQPAFAKRLAAVLQISADQVGPLLAFLAGLHDIGKISRPFQTKSQAHWPSDVLGSFSGNVFDRGHWRYSALLMRHAPISEVLSGIFPRIDEMNRLIAVVAGHHGVPPEDAIWRISIHELDAELPRSCIDAVYVAVGILRNITGILPMLDLSTDVVCRADFLVNGLITYCDWVGSDIEFFAIEDGSEPNPDRYWVRAKANARRALAAKGQSGVLPVGKPDYYGLALSCATSPRPMQEKVQNLPIGDGPNLLVIEDTTGSGKTEAALLLAARLMAAGKGEGIYFALPTTATANAMYDRMTDLRGRLFDGAEASLVLAHGKAKLARQLGALRRPSAADDNGDVSTYCNAWVADSRRLALFADIGVGTIDQTFMGVLRKKHLGLRQAALARRILIVDEAHSFDAYMDVELESLLAAQARNGGSAIVLSATLSRGTRQKLLDAFSGALPPRAPAKTSLYGSPGGRVASKPQALGNVDSAGGHAAYPLLTQATLIATQMHPVDFDPRLSRTVTIERLPGREEAIALALDAASRGAAVGVVCNAVDEAINVYQRIKSNLPDPHAAHLFHARFTVGDRMAIEQDVLARFGKLAEPAARNGRVLVGTQVIEQSLDIDFDLLISDLAPIDLLIQRAGRLWRHMAQRPDSVRAWPKPVMAIVSPDPNGIIDTRWLEPVLGKAAAVYRNPGVLWRSAHTIFKANAITVPDDLRPFVEAVYGDTREPLPHCLSAIDLRATGDERGQGQMAKFNAIDPRYGYLGLGDQLSADEEIGTRLGERTKTIRLTREEAGRLLPYHVEPDADESLNWALSEITLRESLWRKIEPQLAVGNLAEGARKSWPEFEQGIGLLCVSGKNVHSGGDELTYSSKFGLCLLASLRRG